MKKIRNKKRTPLACELSALTLALAAMAPLPAAMAAVGLVAETSAQTNPCAPKPPAKTAPANPCAPQKKAPPANPCAPQKATPVNPCAPKAIDSKAKAGKEACKAPVNPCAPKPPCDNGKTD